MAGSTYLQFAINDILGSEFDAAKTLSSCLARVPMTLLFWIRIRISF